MKKLPLLWVLLLLLLISACKKHPHPPQAVKEIPTTITDAGGKPLSDAYSGAIIQLTSDEFKQWNEAGLIKAQGRLYFDTVPAQIIAAQDNYILTIVPGDGVFRHPSHWRHRPQHRQFKLPALQKLPVVPAHSTGRSIRRL